MRSNPDERAVRRATLCVLACAVLGLAGCGGGGEDRRQTTPEAAVTYQTLRWEAVPGAASYRVRAWTDARLLFEESTVSESLEWFPSLLRAVRAFDDVEVVVEALDDQGRAVGEPQVLPLVEERG